MKLNKILSLGLIVSAGVLYSCSDNDYEWAPVPGAFAYLDAATPTSYTLSTDNTPITMTVYRSEAEGALSVPVTVTPASSDVAVSAFTFPSSVEFAAGSKQATYTINYDSSELEFDLPQQFTLEFAEEYVSPYGIGNITITMTYPSPWELLGVATYIDEFWWVNDDSDTAEVEVYQNGLDPNLFRVVNPYSFDDDGEEYFEFQLLQPGDTFYGQTIPDNLGVTLVGYADFLVQYYDYYSDDLYLVFPGRFTLLANPANWVHNYVVDFQSSGVPAEIHLSPYYYMFNVGGFNQTTTEPITIIFPDVD